MKTWITIALFFLFIADAAAQAEETFEEDQASAWIKVPANTPRTTTTTAAKPPANAAVNNRAGRFVQQTTPPPAKPAETFDRINSKVGRFKKGKG
jgi:hypothetical protein